MFPLLLSLHSSTIYTVDAGYDSVRAGMASNENGVGIIPSAKGFRQTPNLFGFVTESAKNATRERLVFGHKAEIAENRNKSKTMKNPFGYLTNHNGYKFGDLHPSVASALSIRNIVSSITQKDQLILTVPSAATPHLRSMMHEVGQISGFVDVEVIDQSTALASLYAAEKLNKSSKSPKDVLFVDITATKTEVTHWQFLSKNNKINMTLKQFAYSDKASGNMIDALFANFIKSKISKQLDNEEVLKIGRKAKEYLSYNDSISLNIAQINETVNITRDIARQIVVPFTAALEKILLPFDASTFSDVEKAGCGSLFFLVDEMLNAKLSDCNISDSFTAPDSTALGAAYYGAISSRIIAGIKLFISRPAIYNYFVIKGGKEVQLLNAGQPFIRKFFNALEDKKFEFYLAANLSESMYSIVDVEESKLVKGPYTFVTVDGFEKFKIVDKVLLNVTLLPTRGYGEFVVMNVIGKNRKMVFEVSERTPSIELAPPGDSFMAMKKEIEQMKKAASATITQKQELETLLVDAKNKLLYDATTLVVMSEKEIEESLDFIESCFQNLTVLKKSMIKKLNSFAQLKLGPVILRTEEFKERPFAAGVLRNAIARIEERIPFATSDDATVQRVKDVVNTARDYLQKATGIDIHSSPVILCKDLRRRAETLLNKESDLFTGSRAGKGYESQDL